MTLVIRRARVLTLAGVRPRRGTALADLGVLDGADVAMASGRITAIGAGLSAAEHEIDADGRVLLPAFVDCHTHACWAGDRLDEWAMKLRGVSYLDILRAGGGIMSTVRAVRAAPRESLTRWLAERLGGMFALGSGTVEVKSGYGLSADAELKMLRAIHDARAMPGLPTVVPTALLGHAKDTDASDGGTGFVERTIEETLPAVHAAFPDIAVDAFCEAGAWSVDETTRLLSRAAALGHAVRVHTDQFNSLGMLREAIGLGARSVDHLEATAEADLDLLAASATAGVILPVCGAHLDGRFARVRRFADAGGILALATNFNPGSAPCPSMPMAIALAVRHCGISPAEAMSAATVNAAHVLGLTDRGQIAVGQRADLILLNHRDERALAFEFGTNPIAAMVLGGQVLRA
ncbi:MAG: imidazolonepropionase [Phycisphaerales bacterium]